MSKRSYSDFVSGSSFHPNIRRGTNYVALASNGGYYKRNATMRRYQGSRKGLLAMVNRQIAKTEEKKESCQYSLNTPLPVSVNSGWVTSSIPICPYATGFTISQGVGQGQRVGNQIRTKKCWVKGILHPTDYNATTNPQPLPFSVRMLIFKDKFNKSSQPSAVGIDLFQNGSTVLPPQNDLADMVLDINRDRYQVYHDEVLKVGFAGYGGSGALAIFQNFVNNDFSFNAEFNVDVTKFLPKTITYNDVSTSPMGDTLWMIFLPVAANGSQLLANNTGLTMSWSAVYQYTDA